MIEDTPSDSIPPEWLAAYVDRELDEPARRCVERWLAEHPEALEDLEDQECFSRSGDYLASVAPPILSGDDWDKVFAGIAQAVVPAPVRSRMHYRPVARTMLKVAAMLLVLVAVEQLVVNRAPQVKPPLVENPVIAAANEEGDDVVYRVAKVDEVELIKFPESAFNLVVVGRHPMQDVPLLLASAADVQVLNYGPDDQGNLPDFESTSGPDASMLWAPTPKR